MSTPQTQAVGLVNSLISLVQTVTAEAGSIDDLSALWTSAAVANTVNAFATRALNADGSLGAADATPNNQHPIDPAVGVSKALSANDIAGILTSLQGVRDVVNGKAVAANGATISLFAKCLG